jgi:hypothetical protein
MPKFAASLCLASGRDQFRNYAAIAQCKKVCVETFSAETISPINFLIGNFVFLLQNGRRIGLTKWKVSFNNIL